MSDLKYAKSKQAKKRKVHKESILQKKDGYCYLCMKLHNDYIRKITQEHHIFGGPNRPISEAEGMKVYLCLEHHIYGPEAVHRNNKTMRYLQQAAQREYEKTHTRKQFMRLFGRNYLED